MKYAFLLAPVLLVSIQSPASAECTRWGNGLAQCSYGVLSTGVCGTDYEELGETYRRQYNNWRYSSNAQKACEKVIRSSIVDNPDWGAYKCKLSTATLMLPGSWMKAPSPYNDDDYLCTCDLVQGRSDPADTVNAADVSYQYYPITKLHPDPEPICSATPNGPYANVLGMPVPPGTPGGKFSTTLREAVLDENYDVHDSNVTSDLISIEGPDEILYTDPYLNPEAGRVTFLPYSDDNDRDTEADYKTYVEHSTTWNNVQIDHMIPRFDIKGCPCGTNSPANALVVSGRINGQMSNLADHEARRAILKEWTNYFDLYPGALVGPTTGEEAAETDAASGGCSTTGGTGWLVLIGIACAFVRRRRAT